MKVGRFVRVTVVGYWVDVNAFEITIYVKIYNIYSVEVILEIL